METKLLSKAVDHPHNDPGFFLTRSAYTHIQRALDKALNKQFIGVRVGVRKAGCSGFEYKLEFITQAAFTEFDFIFTFDNVTILIDKKTYLQFFKGGTVMDFRKEGLQEGIAFENPNVAHQCGCGESFTLK